MNTYCLNITRSVFAAIVVGLLCLSAASQQVVKPIPDGYQLFDGDLIMEIAVAEAIKSGRFPESTIRTNQWPGGLVPFEFEDVCAPTSTCTNAPNSGCVSAANQTLMLNAMAIIEAVANVDFFQCAGNDCPQNIPSLFIRDSTNDTTVGTGNACVNASGNSSQVGMVANKQVVNMVDWGTQFIIVHELLHALGLYHEQSRADRDQYISILCFNIQGLCQGNIYNVNFSINDTATIYGAYDFDSVMHYDQCAFTTHPSCPATAFSQTIQVKEPFTAQWQNAIGQRTHLSALDRATISFLYPASDWRFYDCNYNGSGGASNGTFLRPYTSFITAYLNTPDGGTLWFTGPCPPHPTGTYSKRITFRAAPNITVRFGG